jgi:hypothetical protein
MVAAHGRESLRVLQADATGMPFVIGGAPGNDYFMQQFEHYVAGGK